MAHSSETAIQRGGAPAAWPGEGDHVTIRNLRAWTLIGVHPHEREARQEIRIDAWLGVDARRGAATDSIDDALDYSAVARAFREHVGRADRQLVETLVEELAALALERFGARWARISLEKPGAIPGADAVGVTIHRSVGARDGGSAGAGARPAPSSGSPR